MNAEQLEALCAQGEEELAPCFARIARISEINTRKVLTAFKNARISATHFAASDGYGYNDRGRELIDEVYAEVFGTEAAIVRHSIANGTHALTIGLFGLLRPGDTLLSVTGELYDTLKGVTEKKDGEGSLPDFGINYKQIDFAIKNGREEFDYPAIEKALEDGTVKVVYVQRSRGYAGRRTLTAAEINELADFVHARSSAFVMVDNCYGEFVEEIEPYRADLLVGSLIKNPGGGMADAGGYMAGSAKAVELVSYRLTVPGIGGEVGATLGQNKNIFRGLFFAPHVVAEAIKTAQLAAYVFSRLGYRVSPEAGEMRQDIIQIIELESADALCAFCRGIQANSPIDSFLTPEPWDMPGYDDQVIMAAGAFVGGSSIELSADGPLRPPFRVFLQGGLTYESGKCGIIGAAEEVIKATNK
ncbi:MAG: methionine gamma-lyase family protein [Clostridia bacterium]|nr:methionine gamma-lyase family protein [Clostridia bacterium]